MVQQHRFKANSLEIGQRRGERQSAPLRTGMRVELSRIRRDGRLDSHLVGAGRAREARAYLRAKYAQAVSGAARRVSCEGRWWRCRVASVEILLSPGIPEQLPQPSPAFLRSVLLADRHVHRCGQRSVHLLQAAAQLGRDLPQRTDAQRARSHRLPLSPPLIGRNRGTLSEGCRQSARGHSGALLG